MARTPSPPASPASSFQWSSEDEVHEVHESRQREPPREAPRESDVQPRVTNRRQSRRNASPNTVPVSRSSQARNSTATRRAATRDFEDEEEEEYSVSRSPSPGAQLFGELQAAMKPRANMRKSQQSIPRPKVRKQEKVVVFTSDEEEGPVETEVEEEGYGQDEHSHTHYSESRSPRRNSVAEDVVFYPDCEEQVRPSKQSAAAIFTSDEEPVHKKACSPAKTQTKRQSIAKRQSLAKPQSKRKNTNKIVIFTSDDDSDAAPARKSPTPSPQPPPRRRPQLEPTPRKKGEYVLSSDSSGSGDEEYLSANETKNNKTVFVSTDKESSRRRGIAVPKKATVNARGRAEKTPTAKKDRARDVHLADLMGRASISGPGIRGGYYQSEDEEEVVERVPVRKSHKPSHGGFVISEAEVSDIDGEASEDEEEDDSTGSMDGFIDDGSQAEEDSNPESEDEDEELYEGDSLNSFIDSQAEEDSEPESGDQRFDSDIDELEKALQE
jgi:hypothetical protein